MMNIDTLENFSFFQDFSKRELETIQCACKPESVRKGKMLFYQSDMTEGAYFLIEGKVNRTKQRSDETSISLGNTEPGAWLGLAETICRSMYLHDCMTLESSVVLHFPVRAFETLINQAVFCKKILDYLGRDYFLLHNQLELNQPHIRIIKNLLNAVSGKPAGGRNVYTTQDELAEINGVTRETVNKHLNRLQNEGILSIGRGKIEILNLEELEKQV
jgi:CRP-like cAMP-binding protein